MSIAETAPYFLSLDPSEDCAKDFSGVLKTLSQFTGRKCLKLSGGRYVFRKKDAREMYFPVSNTVTGEEPQIKHIGLFLENLEDLVIEGNGAQLIFDGDMSAIVIRHCRRLTLKDLIVDYPHPRVSEMSVIKVDGNWAEFAIHRSSRWTADEKGRFCWVNGDGEIETFESRQVVQVASPGNNSNLRTTVNPVRTADSFEVISGNHIRFHYAESPEFRPGEVWQFRDPSRRENGIVIDNSEDIVLDGNKLYFTPGLGIVAQMTGNLKICNHRHAPEPESGRVCAAFADCIQVSSCYGKVEIADSFFSGAQDDPINVHGTYLGVRKICGAQLLLQFCHAETWGWLPYRAGDEVCFVSRKNLERGRSYQVKSAELIDATSVMVTLNEEVSGIDMPEDFVLENMSSYPDTFIHGCIFECYPTRGILLTSAGSCRICDNEIRQISRSAGIYISGDANSWYESGGVRDVTICRNRFRFCPGYAILIDPKVPEDGSCAVHENIRIAKNIFEECNPEYLKYHSAKEVIADI